jgi:glutamate 5-kinase
MVADTHIAHRFAPEACARLVVKIGSALLVDPAGTIRRDWLEGVVADVAERVRAGQQVAIVSSGAIALGARRLGLAKGGRASLEDAQAAAATGQIGLSHAWAE